MVNLYQKIWFNGLDLWSFICAFWKIKFFWLLRPSKSSGPSKKGLYQPFRNIIFYLFYLQNDDFGTVNGLPIKKVSRKNGKAIHFVEAGTPLACGEVVSQKVDWKRRFDHMQQHSGQHLISAYFEKLLNMDTLSWWMADNQDMTKVGVSHIELDAENIDAGRNISMIGLVLIVKITAGYICNFFWIMLFVI